MQSVIEKLREVTPEVYHKLNYKQEVVYPYIVYEYSSELDTSCSDFIFLSLRIHDKGTSPKGTIELERSIRRRLNGLIFSDDEAYYMVKFNSTNTLPLLDEHIQRLDVEYDVKVYHKYPDELKVEHGV